MPGAAHGKSGTDLHMGCSVPPRSGKTHLVPYSVSVLEPAPQGMGAPQATESTQQNGVEALRSFPGRSRPLLEVHLMSATRAKIEICPE